MTPLHRVAVAGGAVLALTAVLPATAFEVAADGIPQPFTSVLGDPARGRAIVADRRVGLCLLCHSGPIPEERFQGNLAPPLDGAGKRWNVAQLRLRVADARLLNPESLMPAFHRPAPLQPDTRRVAAPFRGQPLLNAQQVEDVVAWLATLQ